MYQVWRRRRRSHDSWEKLQGGVGESMSDCLKIMGEAENRVSEIDYEYAVVGSNDGPPGEQTYRDRRMRGR